jgi:hypothetical protein
MGGPEFIVAIVAISCATGLINTWLKRDSNNDKELEQNFDRLARAFVEYKKDMSRRVQNLEAIIADEEPQDRDFSQIEAPVKEGGLNNDLKSKKQVRS